MPGLFEQFPHTNLHELNLDWLIDMLNQFKEELENNAVLSVNGETGHVTLYESENVILPALPEGVDQWRLIRRMNGQNIGILFYNGNVWLQRGNTNLRLLTREDLPETGVLSWNGLTGIVNVTGQNIPVDNSADADSIEQAITNEQTERVNADNAILNTLNNKVFFQSNANVHTWWPATVNISDPANSCIVTRFGRMVLINFQCTLKENLANNNNCILTLPVQYERLTLSRGFVNVTGQTSNDNGIAGYCGFDTWTQDGTLIHGVYIADISAFSNKTVNGQIVFFLKNEPNGEL